MKKISFAHANGFPAGAYEPLFAQLAPTYEVLAKPVLGHDPHYPVAPNWLPLADELAAYIKAHAVAPVIGCGHSMGSLVTFMAACRYPELFRGVLILEPPLIWGRAARLFQAVKHTPWIDRITPAGLSRHRRTQWPDQAAANAYFASKKLFAFEPACFEAFCAAAVTPTAAGEVTLTYRREVEVEVFRNIPHHLKQCQRPPGIPIHIVFADRSNATASRFVVPFAEHFNATYQLIQGEHLFPLQQPALAVDLIRQFCERIP